MGFEICEKLTDFQQPFRVIFRCVCKLINHRGMAPPSLPTPSPTAIDTEEQEPSPPICEALVLRPAWKFCNLYRILPDACVADLLIGTTIHRQCDTVALDYLGRTVELQIVARTPRLQEEGGLESDTYTGVCIVTRETHVHIIPALAPLNSGRENETKICGQLVRFLSCVLHSSELAPSCALVTATSEDLNDASSNIRQTAERCGFSVLCYRPAALNLGHGAQGVAIALEKALCAAVSAAPALILLENTHFLAPTACPGNAAAVALFMRKVAQVVSGMDTPKIAVILTVAPDARSVHPYVRNQCPVTIQYQPSPERIDQVAGLLIADFQSLSVSPSTPAPTSASPPSWLSTLEKSVGGTGEAKERLERLLVWRRSRSRVYKALGVVPSTGILLYGAPGTGKTLITRIAGAAAGYAMHNIECGKLARGEVGQSEKELDALIEKATNNDSAIVFIDEMDALFRTGRLVDKLCDIFDTLSINNKNTLIIGATNRPWRVNAQLLRGGRFENLIYMQLPNEIERAAIAAVHARKMRLGEREMRECIRMAADNGEGMSGADIAGTCRRAAMLAAARGSSPAHQGECDVSVGDVRTAFAAKKRSVPLETVQELDGWASNKSGNL